jgi:hypothetical protein
MEENDGGQLLIASLWNTKLSRDGHVLPIYSTFQELRIFESDRPCRVDPDGCGLL